MQISTNAEMMRNALIERVLLRSSGVFHLGAHFGSSARRYAQLRKNVVWVEAVPDVCNELCRRIQTYATQSAVCALLDEVDGTEKKFYISNNQNGVSSSMFSFGEYGSGVNSLWPELDLKMTSEIMLRTTRLDTLLNDYGIEPSRHDFWELDLQGSELNCLKGGESALKFATAIYAETSQVPVYDGGVLLPDLEHYLEGAGFVPLWEPELLHDNVLYIRPEHWARLGGAEITTWTIECRNGSYSNDLLQRSYSDLFDNGGRNIVFCAAPFIQVLLDPYGVAHPCGMMNDYPIGNLAIDSMDTIWNGEKIRALRREFISGEITTCDRLIRHTECNKCFSSFEYLVIRSEVQPLPPRRLDVRLNGRCNLECVMCHVWKEPNGVYDSIRFWIDGPEKIFPNLLEVCVLGGEPFVQKDTFRLIREVSRVNKSCDWSFTTNCNWKLTPKFKSTLDLIRIKTISASIDSLKPDVYARIRKRGNLRMALQTVDDLVDYRSDRISRGLCDMDICMRMVIRADNYQEVPEFIDYATERGIYPDFSFQREPPTSGGLIGCPPEVRLDALNFLQDCLVRKGAVSLGPILDELRACISDKESRHSQKIDLLGQIA